MINVDTGKGFLNDWDLCKYREDLEGSKGASEPSGISVRKTLACHPIVSSLNVAIYRGHGLSSRVTLSNTLASRQNSQTTWNHSST